MPRGGRRAGKPGASYTNRTDLNQTPRAATGQTYGTAGAQLESQKTIPLPTTGGLPTATPAPAASAGAGVLPGSLTPLDAPTERPGEPITHGLPTGPGAGPEALSMLPKEGVANLEKLRPLLPVLELIASRPETGTEARNLVRRLRGALG